MFEKTIFFCIFFCFLGAKQIFKMLHSMSFNWSSNIGDFFIKGLTIDTVTSFSLLCIILVVFSIVYEAMKVKLRYNNTIYTSTQFVLIASGTFCQSSSAGCPRTSTILIVCAQWNGQSAIRRPKSQKRFKENVPDGRRSVRFFTTQYSGLCFDAVGYDL